MSSTGRRTPGANSSHYLSPASMDRHDPSLSSLISSTQAHSSIMDRKASSSSSSHNSHSHGRKPASRTTATLLEATPSSPPVSSRQEQPVKKQKSWKDLRKKPSLLSQKEPPTPNYILHPPVSHLSPAPPPMPARYTTLPVRNTGPPLASLYCVAGLPKQTHTWTVADPSAISGVHHRPGAIGGWWRAEVLGSNTAPVPTNNSSPGSGNGNGGNAEAGEEWSQRLSGKALKYSFPREIEVINSTLQPPSTVHSFSFDLASPHPGSTTGVRSSTSSTRDGVTTFHGVTLTVYSHADATKTAAIRKALEAAAAPQTSTSSKFGPSRSGAFGGFGAEEAMPRSRTGSLAGGGGEYWLPYALTLVSKFPIYSFMSDYLKISWAKFSKDVARHSAQMTKIIHTPSPRAGDLIRLKIASTSAEDHDEDSDPDALEIVATLPGQLNLDNGLIDIGWEMWPFFKVLSLDNVITVVETALSPNGRVVFHSRHPALLGAAVQTLKYICELRGWDGMAHSSVHARDVQLLIEDGGPWILGLDTEAKYIVKIATDICVVDLDINFVLLPGPSPNVLSTGDQRSKIKTRLQKAFGDGNGYFTEHTVPAEFMEAYPGGRLRPLCETRTASGEPDALSAERIEEPLWWDQARVMGAFDQLLAYKAKKPGFFKRLGAGDKLKTRELSMGEKVARTNMRKRANQFVDARDEMESKLGRLSRRLAFLVHETDVWKERFTQFEELTEKLGVEANELKSRIEKEKRESKRLSSVVGAKEKEKEDLRSKLRETEEARHAALSKMKEMDEAMKTIERERDEMMASIDAQLENVLGSANGLDSSISVAPSSPSVSRTSSVRTASRNGGGKPSDALLKLGGVGSGSGGANKPAESLNVVQEEAATPTRSKKRFSAMGGRAQGKDEFDEIDGRITAQSQSVSDKVSAIQLKLDLALKSITAHNARQSIDGLGRGSFDVEDRDLAGSPSTPNVDDDEHEDAVVHPPNSPATPVASRTSGHIISAIASIFTSGSSDATPRQSIAVHASDAPPAPPSSFKSPAQANRSSAEVSADTTDSQEEFQSADDASPPTSDDEDEDDPDKTLLNTDQPSLPPPPRAARTKYTRPPSTTAFGMSPQPLPLPVKHGKEESDATLSSEGERSLSFSTSEESVRTAGRKKSVGGSGEEELVVPELARMPGRRVVNVK